MKTIPQFYVNFAWIVPVEAAEGEAVIGEQVTIGNIERVQRGGETLAEILADREVESGVLRQVSGRGIAISKSRAIVDVCGSIGMPGKIDVAAGIQSVALVMVKGKELGAGRKISQAAGNGAAGAGNLVGICEVDASPVSEQRRAEGEFPSTNDCLRNRQRKENVRFADVAVIKEIVGVGLKCVGIDRPTAVGDGDAELMFFVALAVQRNEGEIVLIDELKQRAGGSK